MFSKKTAVTFSGGNFSTETSYEEKRPLLIFTFSLVPFPAAHAESPNVRPPLFGASTGTLKPALEAVVALINMDEQRVTFAMSPDQQDRRIVLPNVRIEEKLRAKVKHDREPAVCEAVLKVSFVYPTPDVLMYIANGV